MAVTGLEVALPASNGIREGILNHREEKLQD
jgi:hypothetical protein